MCNTSLIGGTVPPKCRLMGGGGCTGTVTAAATWCGGPWSKAEGRGKGRGEREAMNAWLADYGWSAHRVPRRAAGAPPLHPCLPLSCKCPGYRPELQEAWVWSLREI